MTEDEKLISYQECGCDECMEQIANILGDRHQCQDHPLSKKIVDNLPEIIATEEHVGKMCTICMEKIKIGESITKLNCKCGHFYHTKPENSDEPCIKGWLKHQKLLSTLPYRNSWIKII